MEFDYLNYIIFPLLIFMVRIADVSLGTVRIVCVSKDMRALAAFLGFLEVTIWLFAITQIMQNISNPVQYVAYAAGFGMGNYVGITIERKLSMGSRMIRIITKNNAKELIASLRSRGFGATSIDGEGLEGPVKVIFSVVRRSKVADVVNIAKEHNPKAFFTVEEISQLSDSSSLNNNGQNRFYFLEKFNRRR